MNTQTMIADLQDEAGWDSDTMLSILTDYLDRQQSPEALRSFLWKRRREEIRASLPDLIEGSIDVPSCWQDLLRTVFDESLQGIPDGDIVGSEVAANDPQPHYDDSRLVETSICDSPPLRYALKLNSGQNNYWAAEEVYVSSAPTVSLGLLYRSEPICELLGESDFVMAGGAEVVIEYHYTTDDD